MSGYIQVLRGATRWNRGTGFVSPYPVRFCATDQSGTTHVLICGHVCRNGGLIERGDENIVCCNCSKEKLFMGQQCEICSIKVASIIKDPT